MLTDLDGDGRLQWVVTQPGVHGQYRQQTDNPNSGCILHRSVPCRWNTAIRRTNDRYRRYRCHRPGAHRSAQCAHLAGSKDGWLSAKDIPQSEKLSCRHRTAMPPHWLLSVMCSAPDNNIWYRSVRAECFAGRIWVTAALVSRWHWTVSAKTDGIQCRICLSRRY